MTDAGIDPQLFGVPQTLLWTLWQRACEARRPDAVLVTAQGLLMYLRREEVDALVRALPMPRGRGPAFGFLLPLLHGRVGPLRRRFLLVNRLTFGG